MMHAKKPFPKLGVLIIIFAVACIYLINTGPWLHYSANWYSGEVDEFLYKDLEGVNSSVEFFFNPPHAYLHGIFADFFEESPRLALYGLISLLIIGIIITLFGIIDRKKNFQIINYYTIHFILYSIIIIPCVFIITAVIRFLQIYILGGHNFGTGDELIKILGEDFTNMPKAVPPMSYMLIISSLVIITIVFTVMDSNLRIIREESESLSKKLKQKNKSISSKKITYRYNRGDDQT
jgi:hypothetical protein